MYPVTDVPGDMGPGPTETVARSQTGRCTGT